MYAGYGAMMISRQMVTILSPALLADESLNFTVKDTGDILAYGTVGAMVGKLIWGPLADKIGGRLTFLIGIVLTALLVAAFGLSQNVVAFTVCSALLYCTKSSGWPGMTKIVGEWYLPRQYGRVWSILSTSSRASVVLGTLFFGWLLAFFHWRTVAFLSTAMALLVYAVCRFFLQDKPTDPDFWKDDQEAAAALADKQKHPLDGTSLWTGLWAFASSSRVWFVIVMLMALTCAMAFLDFLPAYLMENFQLTPSQASMASSYMPLGSLIGLVVSIVCYDRFSKKQLRAVLTATLAVATLCIVTLQFLPQLSISSGLEPPHCQGTDPAVRSHDVAGVLYSDEHIFHRVWWSSFGHLGLLDRHVRLCGQCLVWIPGRSPGSGRGRLDQFHDDADRHRCRRHDLHLAVHEW